MSTFHDVLTTLGIHKNPERAKTSAWFFKSGPGEYAEGDVFWGIPVPVQRSIAKQYSDLPRSGIEQMLSSPVHEVRLTAVFILVNQYKVGDQIVKERCADFYLKHRKYINNWDLVDSSAPHILGDFYKDKTKEVLYTLAHSSVVWERRIAMISTFSYIKQGVIEDAVNIAALLLNDTHDLIHKAVGWMLREIGKHRQSVLLAFLDEHAAAMPRTMLRYAIEHLPENLRQQYLLKKYNSKN